MTIISNVNVSRDAIYSIFLKLDPSSLRECAKVCAAFRKIVLSEEFLRQIFPDVVLPEGMTKRQWLMQKFHNQNDALICVKYFCDQVSKGKNVAFQIRSPSGVLLNISLGYGIEVFTQFNNYTTVRSNIDILPVAHRTDQLHHWLPLYRGSRDLPMGSVVARKAPFDDNTANLLLEIELIYNKLCVEVADAQKRDAQESKVSTFALGVAAGVTFMTLAAMVVRYRK
jgi:hypothetical protein